METAKDDEYNSTSTTTCAPESAQTPSTRSGDRVGVHSRLLFKFLTRSRSNPAGSGSGMHYMNPSYNIATSTTNNYNNTSPKADGEVALADWEQLPLLTHSVAWNCRYITHEVPVLDIVIAKLGVCCGQGIEKVLQKFPQWTNTSFSSEFYRIESTLQQFRQIDT